MLFPCPDAPHPRQDCTWNYEVQGCWGGEVEPALTYVYDHGGIALESAYPYAGQNGFCKCAKAGSLACPA